MHAFEVAAVKERLRQAGGCYEIVHESAGLEVGALHRPRGNRRPRRRRRAGPGEGRHRVFVEAGAEHRFTAYEHLSMLVIFERKPAENP